MPRNLILGVNMSIPLLNGAACLFTDLHMIAYYWICAWHTCNVSSNARTSLLGY
jgi:hypothetical protein